MLAATVNNKQQRRAEGRANPEAILAKLISIYVEVIINIKKVIISLFLSQAIYLQLALANSNSIKIPDVTVTSTQTISNVTTPSNVVVITQQQIAAVGAKSLSELLATQSILQLSNASGDNSQTIISMRGFGDNAAANSLILVDGFRLANPDLTAPDLSSILLPDIERIEIISGSQGTLFGDQVVGGVINIITRKPKKFMARLLSGYGSYNQQLYQAYFADMCTNGLGYQISGAINKTNNYRAHNDQENNNVNARVFYEYKNGSLFAKYQHYINNLLYPGSLTAQQFRDNPQQSFINSNFRDSRTTVYETSLKQFLNKQWAWTTNFVHRYTDASGYVFQRFNQGFTINGLESRLIGNIYQQTITVGAYLENDWYQSTTTNFSNHAHLTQYNIFLQNVAHLTSKLDLILGLRKAIQSNFIALSENNSLNFTDSALVTEQGINYQLNPAWRLYLRRDGNFRFPKANESTWVVTGTDHLDAQTGVSYEGGAEWQQARKNFRLSLYHLRLNHEIAFDSTQTMTQPFGANRNLDLTIRNGVIISSSYPLCSRWDINGQYSYVDAHFAGGQYKNNTIPGVVNQSATIAAFYQLTTGTKLYAQEMYVSSRFASNDDANVAGKLSGYWLSNLGLAYDYKAIKLNFRINNLFNRAYSLYTVYDPSSGGLAYYPATGRNFLLTIGINIG